MIPSFLWGESGVRVLSERSGARELLCFAQGRPGQWEAFCVDFDISVQGESFHEVQDSLEQAVRLYVESAKEEGDADRVRLLSRRAPRLVVLGWMARVLLSAFKHRGGGDGSSAASTASFPVPCDLSRRHRRARPDCLVAAHRMSDDIRPGTLPSMIRQSGLPKRLFRG